MLWYTFLVLSNLLFHHVITIMEERVMKTHQRHPSMTEGLSVRKFIRRSDLSSFVRLQIAFTALLAQQKRQWGTMTQLARHYLISRTFVYMLAATLEQTTQIVFGKQRSPAVVRDEQLAYQYMVSLRLEGRCSIGAISTLMKRFDVEYSSTGKMSQTLHDLGALLPKTLCTHDGEIQLVVFLSDELFAKGCPILVTVEPQSSALLCVELSDTRQWEDWKQHWECLEDNGYHAIYLVSDGGQALIKAQKEALVDIFRQPDTYHAIAHRLGGSVKRLEREAYAAIEQEDDYRKKLRFARTVKARKTCRQNQTNARKRAAKKIDRYEDYAYLYQCLVEELRLFDDTGHLRDRQKAEGNMATALDLLDTLEVGYISDAVQKVRREFPELLTYFDVAASVVTHLQDLPLAQETFRVLCVAWSGYYMMTQYPSQLHKIEAHIRRRLRSRLVDQQKRRRYLFKKLLKRHVSRGLAAKTVFSNKGRWALSHSHAVEQAYPNRWFINQMGLRTRSDETHPHWLSLKEWIQVT